MGKWKIFKGQIKLYIQRVITQIKQQLTHTLSIPCLLLLLIVLIIISKRRHLAIQLLQSLINYTVKKTSTTKLKIRVTKSHHKVQLTTHFWKPDCKDCNATKSSSDRWNATHTHKEKQQNISIHSHSQVGAQQIRKKKAVRCTLYAHKDLLCKINCINGKINDVRT